MALIAVVLAYTSWENRLSIVLMVAFGCAMYALRDADQTLNGIAAARWGIAVMLAYWLIHTLNRPRQQLAPIRPPTAHGAVAGAAPAAVIPPPPAAEAPPAESKPPEPPPESGTHSA